MRGGRSPVAIQQWRDGGVVDEEAIEEGRRPEEEREELTDGSGNR